MKINIDRNKILPSLNIIGNVVEKSQTMPILSHIYLRLASGKLMMVASDLEVEVSEVISNVKGDNGEFTVSMQKIFDISRQLPEKSKIDLVQEKGKVVLTSERSRFELKTLSAKEFPRIVEDKWDDKFKIKQSLLKSVLNKTAFSMAVQDVRYYLNGILFQLSKQQLRAVATDGHRLAQTDVKVNLDIKSDRDVIVPRKAVNQLERFLDNADGEKDEVEVVVEISQNHMRVTKGNTSLITKLIDGKFPEFKETLEKEPDISIEVNKSEFVSALSRAGIITEANDRLRGVKLQLGKDNLRITGRNPEQEEAVEELSTEFSGEPVEIGFNLGYLSESANACETEKVQVNFRSSDNVCFIKQPGDNKTIWLIMPMRI